MRVGFGIMTALVVAASSSSVEAFVTPSPAHASNNKCSSSAVLEMSKHNGDQEMTRRNAMWGVVSKTAVAVGTLGIMGPQPAAADALSARNVITSKIAASASLRKVKSCLKELQGMELYVAMNDYTQVHDAIRVPPLTEVRKSCKILVAANEEDAELESLYADFIKQLEALDSAAGLALRGKKDVDLNTSYQASVANLSKFVQVASDRATVISAPSSE
jgi:hypothetical protein